MTGRVMMLYEPWEVAAMPEAGRVRVLACYPAALQALREAAGPEATGPSLDDWAAFERSFLRLA